MLELVTAFFELEVVDFFISKILIVLGIVVILRFAKKIISMI